jgi:hypothetical protein|tara:strand:- start:3482 stop:5425 length:1944 start_codon:yes stop_codon:yes gene_type:complete
MPNKTILNQEFNGVDMHKDPLLIADGKVAEAINLQFEEGRIKTRDGVYHHEIGEGQFQGSTVYSPSRGLSHKPFSDPYVSLMVAISGKIYANLMFNGLFNKPFEVKGCDFEKCVEINLYQAENYLIIQSIKSDTAWWEGIGQMICSPGLDAKEQEIEERVCKRTRENIELIGGEVDCCFQKIEYCKDTPDLGPESPHSSHDTFIFTEHKNFLINSAGLGIYAHGRIHQQGPYAIFVSDIIHKRGSKSTDDILLMEEQQTASMAPPLSTNSKLGQLRAIEVMPELNSANGEGQIIAYYDRGVVSYNTNLPARETQYDAEGVKVRDGWDQTRQVSHILNSVSAVGRYAVADLPRDHVFRSRFGIHFLKSTIGEGTFKDEYINTFSQDVSKILECDSAHMLEGTTVGQWRDNHRVLCSVGMIQDNTISATTFGRGLVVWNQSNTYTEDRTPRSAWEGLWLLDSEMAGFHKLCNIDESSSYSNFGGVTSDAYGKIYFSEFVKGQTKDVRDNEDILIEWRITTKRETFNGLAKTAEVTGGRLDLIVDKDTKVRVSVRTDETDEWKVWREVSPDCLDRSIISIDLGKTPFDVGEGTWFQFRIDGLGYAEILDFEIEYGDKSSKINKTIPCKDYVEDTDDLYEFSKKPQNERWS